jgi:uncharacterized membrane protein
MTARSLLRTLLALMMVAVGVMHFASPRPFLQIMPALIPSSLHLALVHVSGVFEILGGAGLLVTRARSFAGWGLCALYVAVFPANINMAVNRIPMGESEWPTWALWGRLPLQLALIALAYWVSRPDSKSSPRSQAPLPPGS